MHLHTLFIFLYYLTSFSLVSSRHFKRAVEDPDLVGLNLGLFDPNSVDIGSDGLPQPNLDAYDNFEVPESGDLAFRTDPNCPKGTKISCCLGNRCVSWNVSPDHQYCKKSIICCAGIDWSVVLDDFDHLIGKGISCKNQPATGNVKTGVLDFLRMEVPNPFNGIGGGGGGGALGGAGAAGAGGAILDW